MIILLLVSDFEMPWTIFRETPEGLLAKVQTILKVTYKIRRDIAVTKVARMYTGFW